MTWRLVALALLAASCADAPKPVDRAAALGGDSAARVGAHTLPVALVARVAADQRAQPREALRRVVDDAIAAESAAARGLDARVPASWLLTAARARFTADRLLFEARAKGPPTDAEVKKLSAVHWREVDRPPAVRVQHALVMRPRAPEVAAAKALASALHGAVATAATGEDFRAAASGVPHGRELEVRVEDLPPFIEDGQLVDSSGSMVGPFAKVAHALAKAGDTSGVVETEFGWHVIRMVERLPEQRVPFEARRAAFEDEVVTTRAREALEARLDALARATTVSLAPNAEQLMRGVRASAP